MSLLQNFKVVQIGDGLAAAVAGRLFADVGAIVSCIDPDTSPTLAAYLDHSKLVVPIERSAQRTAIANADLIVCEGSPRSLRALQRDVDTLRRLNSTAALICISPFGQTGPRAHDPATDLTSFFASGIARLLTGQVDDPAEPQIRPAGEQSAFIGGLSAACAGMHAALAAPGATVDVSIVETLATMAITELSRAGLGGKIRSRQREADGNGATVTILPARDGYFAISPREDRQWASWLAVMGWPDWGSDPRFATKPDRVANWDALYTLMSTWSRQYSKQWIADAAQAAHVPSFPLREPAEQFSSSQLEHRKFWRSIELGGRRIRIPGPPFGLRIAPAIGNSPGRGAGPMPLSGVRVLDFSWVIAGPTATRYLAAMGADVIKVEAPGRSDPGRASELHTVLGQAKRSIVLDLKRPEGAATARALASRSDVVVENFATGVMDRLGLGPEELQTLNPDLIYVSASGLGRTGPEACAVAYGTLLQCYAGFAGLNRHPHIPPRVGFAWLDPMCGLMLAFIVAAALWHRRRAAGIARVDFSMIEAMLWTMAEPLLATQLGASPSPCGTDSSRHVPHGVYRCTGEDDWISICITTDAEWRNLCRLVPGLAYMMEFGVGERERHRRAIDQALAVWVSPKTACAAENELRRAGIPAAALANSQDLVDSDHLKERGFWERHSAGFLPGLPWRASFGRTCGPAPQLGADTETILTDLLELSPDEIAALHMSHILG